MKKILFCLGISLVSLASSAQKGLKSVIVEKYYISNYDDSVKTYEIDTTNFLPTGSVTYRIFLEMDQGYKFESLYGNADHELRFQTSTFFFNNTSNGAISPNTISTTQEKQGSTMLDSWLSAGAACKGYYGIPKSKDDGVTTIVNIDGILKNNDTLMGIPLTTQDGMIQAKVTMPQLMTPGLVGFDLDSVNHNDISYFLESVDNSSVQGQALYTNNGSMYVASGAYGPDSANNNVILIAQLTTDGVFTFKLNVQLGSPGQNSNAIDFVASNPIPNRVSPNVPEATITGLIDTLRPAKKGTVSSKIVAKSIPVKVYPNPVSDNLNIDFTNGVNTEQGGTIQLYDVIGNLVSSKPIQATNEKINVSTLSNGIYYLVLSTKDAKSTYKVFKK